MRRLSSPILITVFLPTILLATSAFTAEPAAVSGLSLEKARLCITGFDHNRPDPFPGLGDFIGWVGGVNRLANGELLCVHVGHADSHRFEWISDSSNQISQSDRYLLQTVMVYVCD